MFNYSYVSIMLAINAFLTCGMQAILNFKLKFLNLLTRYNQEVFTTTSWTYVHTVFETKPFHQENTKTPQNKGFWPFLRTFLIYVICQRSSRSFSATKTQFEPI